MLLNNQWANDEIKEKSEKKILQDKWTWIWTKINGMEQKEFWEGSS